MFVNRILCQRAVRTVQLTRRGMETSTIDNNTNWKITHDYDHPLENVEKFNHQEELVNNKRGSEREMHCRNSRVKHAITLTVCYGSEESKHYPTNDTVTRKYTRFMRLSYQRRVEWG